MLPYFEQPHVDLGPIPIHAFGVLVVSAVLVGTELSAYRAKRLGIDPNTMTAFAMWLLVPGFICAHVFEELWYHPEEVARNPAVLFDLFFGMSSFGGFLGAVLGAVAWRFTMKEPILPRIDIVMSAFPIAWALGRAGCTLAHDHPGLRTSADNPLAFAYPDGARWDLGFLEMLFALALAGVFAVLWRRPTPTGTYTAIACLAYAPVRFGLDFLRADATGGGDVRYAGLTPAQWACFALATLGLVALRAASEERGRARRSDRTASEASPST